MMIYLNNAATSYPKPQCVIDAHVAALHSAPESEGRSTFMPTSENIMDECRKNLAHVLGTKQSDRIFFTAGATDSINRIIGGLPLSNLPVLVTQTEHNSVLRPILNNDMTAKNVNVIPCDGAGRVSADAVEAAINRCGLAFKSEAKGKSRGFKGLLIVNHCSNVTGTVQDIAAFCDIAHRHQMLCMVDAAQSAGAMQVDIDDTQADIVAFTGHKGLLGPQGTGGYFISEKVPLRPTLFGGTGRNSKLLEYRRNDFEYEPGTQNLPGIAALNAGAKHIINEGMSNIMDKERKMISRLREALRQKSTITLYGDDEPLCGTALSFNVKGVTASDVGYILQNAYDITVRTGMHCSPLIHKALDTYEHGTVRISVTHLTPTEHIEAFIKAINEIAENVM